MQLAAHLGGSQQQSVMCQPAQLLQVRQALAQQQATAIVARQAEIQKRIEAEATKRAGELVKTEKEKQKQKSAQDANATKQVEDNTTSRRSAGGRSQGARKRTDIADANAEKAKVEKERGGLREALDILEARLGTGTRQYDSEDGTRPSRVKKTTVARVICSVSSKKGAPSQEHGIVELDAEESVAERMARLLTHQAGARASSLPEIRKMTRQSPRLSTKSGQSAGSDMRSGSQPHKHKLAFADALAVAPTPEEKKAREGVGARKRRNKKTHPEG